MPLSAGATGGATVDLTQNLVGHWKFDEGAGGTANDSSPNANNMILTDYTWVTGSVGPYAINFGSSGFAGGYAPDTPAQNIAGAFTVTCRAKWSTSALSRGLATKFDATLGRKFGLIVPGSTGDDDKVRMVIWVGGTVYSATSTATYNDGAWHTFIGLYDKSNVQLYIFDDTGAIEEPIIGDAQTGDTDSSTCPLDVGNINAGGWQFPEADIDEVRLYDAAIDADMLAGIAAL